MVDKKTADHEKTIHQMVHVVLGDILESVIREFEAATKTKIGAIHIGPEDAVMQRRWVEIHIHKADSDSLSGLMRYQKLLCDYEPLKNSDFCKHANN